MHPIDWTVLTFLLPMGAVLGTWNSVLPAAALWAGLDWYVLRGGKSFPVRESPA